MPNLLRLSQSEPGFPTLFLYLPWRRLSDEILKPADVSSGFRAPVTIPSSQTANEITATEFFGKRRSISGRLGFAAGFIPEVRPGHVNASPLSASDNACELISVRKNELDPCGLSMPR